MSPTRRNFFRLFGLASLGSIAGCSGDQSSVRTTTSDTDGDGFPDSIDDLPNDPRYNEYVELGELYVVEPRKIKGVPGISGLSDDIEDLSIEIDVTGSDVALYMVKNWSWEGYPTRSISESRMERIRNTSVDSWEAPVQDEVTITQDIGDMYQFFLVNFSDAEETCYFRFALKIDHNSPEGDPDFQQ